MTVIQAQLIAGLVITIVMALVPVLVDIVTAIRNKRAEKRAVAECAQLWLAMDEDLYGNDAIDIDYDALVDVDLDNTCEFDHNRQG